MPNSTTPRSQREASRKAREIRKEAGLDEGHTFAVSEIRGFVGDDFDPLLTPREVCRLLGRSHSSLYRDIAAGVIPAPLKIGSSSRWPASEIRTLVEQAKAARDAGGA